MSCLYCTMEITEACLKVAYRIFVKIKPFDIGEFRSIGQALLRLISFFFRFSLPLYHPGLLQISLLQQVLSAYMSCHTVGSMTL